MGVCLNPLVGMAVSHLLFCCMLYVLGKVLIYMYDIHFVSTDMIQPYLGSPSDPELSLADKAGCSVAVSSATHKVQFVADLGL